MFVRDPHYWADNKITNHSFKNGDVLLPKWQTISNIERYILSFAEKDLTNKDCGWNWKVWTNTALLEKDIGRVLEVPSLLTCRWTSLKCKRMWNVRENKSWQRYRNVRTQMIKTGTPSMNKNISNLGEQVWKIHTTQHDSFDSRFQLLLH